MNNAPEIWLNIEEVCELSNSKKETIRRKCKSGEYKARFKIDGRKKIMKYFYLRFLLNIFKNIIHICNLLQLKTKVLKIIQMLQSLDAFLDFIA